MVNSFNTLGERDSKPAQPPSVRPPDPNATVKVDALRLAELVVNADPGEPFPVADLHRLGSTPQGTFERPADPVPLPGEPVEPRRLGWLGLLFLGVLLIAASLGAIALGGRLLR